MTPKQLNEALKVLRPLVIRMAKKAIVKLPASVEVDDLVQSALERLCRELPQYDPTTGNKLETFAYSRIEGAFLDELRRSDYFSRSVRGAIKKIENMRYRLAQSLGRQPTNLELRVACDLSHEDYYELLGLIETARHASLDEDEDPDNFGCQIPSEEGMSSVEQAVWERECVERFSRFKGTLSQIEQDVLTGYLDGVRGAVLAEQLGCLEWKPLYILNTVIAKTERRLGG